MDAAVTADPHVIVNSCGHDLHIYTTLRSGDEDLGRGVVGNEVWISDVETSLRGNDRNVVHDANRGRSGFRRTENGLGGHGSCRVGGREKTFAAHQLTGRIEPILRETRLQSNSAGPLHTNLDIVPVFGVLSV